MPTEDVRQLPAVEKRVETGAVQFGDDWPGLFVRGDDAGPLFVAWQSAESQLPDLPRAVETVIDPLRRVMETIRDDVDCGDTLQRFEESVQTFHERMEKDPPPTVDPEVVERLWWECRTIPMTWAGQHCYDPIARIRAGEKTHTLRGRPYTSGTILQVTANSETRTSRKRIPLWLRVTGCEGVGDPEIASDEFARSDGFVPGPDEDRSPAECMWDFAREYVPNRIVESATDAMYESGYLVRFEIIRDEMEGGA